MSLTEKKEAIAILDGIAAQLHEQEYEYIRKEILKGNMTFIDILHMSSGAEMIEDLHCMLRKYRPGECPPMHSSSAASLIAEAIIRHAWLSESTKMPWSWKPLTFLSILLDTVSKMAAMK